MVDALVGGLAQLCAEGGQVQSSHEGWQRSEWQNRLEKTLFRCCRDCFHLEPEVVACRASLVFADMFAGM